MINVKITKTAVIPIHNELDGLQRWLRPGFLAFLVGQYIDAIRPYAVKLSSERERMLDEAAAKEPEFLDTEQTKKNPKAGKNVVRDLGDGRTFTVFSSPESGEEFKQREEELFAGSITIQAERKFTIADLEKLERERLSKPRIESRNRENDDPEFWIEFSILLPLIETTSAPAIAEDTSLVRPDSPST